MEHEKCQELAKLVDTITTSGKTILDAKLMKQIKNICKQSDEYVSHCYHLCMTQLEKEHSEIRFSSVLIIEELFNRSHCFREKVLLDFQTFMELTLETDLEIPLPPPKKAAMALRGKTMRMIHQWQTKFGDTYKKLTLAYNFLKHCKKIDFGSMEARGEAERRNEALQKEKALKQEQARVQMAIAEITGLKNELKNSLLQAESCMILLMPEPETFNINGLRSPDPHRTSNPWSLRSPEIHRRRPSYRRKSMDSSTDTIRKSLDGSKVKCSRKSRTSVESVNEEEKSSRISTVPKADVESEVNLSLVKTELCNNCHNCGKETSENLLRESSCKCREKDFQVRNTTNKTYSMSESTDDCQNIKLEMESETNTNSKKNSVNNQTKLKEQEDSDDFQEVSTSESDSSVEGSEEEDLYYESDYEDYDPVAPSSRLHGLSSQYGGDMNISISLTSDVITITQTSDNEDVINTLKESVQLADKKFLPTIQKSLEIFTKAGNQEQIRRCLDIKAVISNMKNKVSKLKFVRTAAVKKHRNSIKSEGDSDSDGDFEDVPDAPEGTLMEGYEPPVPVKLTENNGPVDNNVQKPATQSEWTIQDSVSQESNIEDPTTYAATLRRNKLIPRPGSSEKDVCKSATSSGLDSSSKPGPSSSNTCNEELKKKAPRVPFNTDLNYWGKAVEAPLILNYDLQHRFWHSKDGSDDIIDKNALSAMTSRVINYTGSFQPVTHRCNAPLPSGKLCPRMDRVKCPFHGVIVPRDDMGEPTNPKDRLRLQDEKEKKQQESVPEWEDPQLQQDILAATGVDVSRKGKGKGGKGGKGRKKGQRKHPNLTYIGPKPKTSHGRLEAKVFNKRTMKRVATVLSDIDEKRHKDKFANQFHYSLKK